MNENSKQTNIQDTRFFLIKNKFKGRENTKQPTKAAWNHNIKQRKSPPEGKTRERYPPS